jgi:hypothetical protein
MSKFERTTLIHDYYARGRELVPVGSNKRPTVEWSKPVQEATCLAHDGDIAMICGARSGGVECIDVDIKYDLTFTLMDRLEAKMKEYDAKLYESLTLQMTQNKGFHIVYRCDNYTGNLKLASRPTTDAEREKDPHQKTKVLLETRGEGGYFLVPPSGGYMLMNGDLKEPVKITDEQRDKLLDICREFNEVAEKPKSEPKPKPKPATTNTGYGTGTGYGSEVKPGEDYENRGDVIALLERHGWTEAFFAKGQHYMKRPGDTESKYGATYHPEKRAFYVFTSSSEFEPSTSYSPMGVFAVLECNGDYAEAAKLLGEQGYGEKKYEKHERVEKPDPETWTFPEHFEDDVLYQVARGTREMGKAFGVRTLDRYLAYKKNQYLLVVGNQNVGKTFVVLWMLTMLAKKHGMKFLVLIMENDVNQAKRDIAQFYTETLIVKGSSEAAVKEGLEFANKHFRFLNTIDHRYDYKTALKAAEQTFDKWQYDGFFIDPYNAMQMNLKGTGLSGYDYHLEASNEIQHFTKRVVSVILSCHVTSEAARSGVAPILDNVQGGMSFTAKAHDGIVIYRNMKDPHDKYITEISVSKIKDRQTGGDWTPYDQPIRLKMEFEPRYKFLEEGSVEWKLHNEGAAEVPTPAPFEDKNVEVTVWKKLNEDGSLGPTVKDGDIPF